MLYRKFRRAGRSRDACEEQFSNVLLTEVPKLALKRPAARNSDSPDVCMFSAPFRYLPISYGILHFHWPAILAIVEVLGGLWDSSINEIIKDNTSCRIRGSVEVEQREHDLLQGPHPNWLKCSKPLSSGWLSGSCMLSLHHQNCVREWGASCQALKNLWIAGLGYWDVTEFTNTWMDVLHDA